MIFMIRNFQPPGEDSPSVFDFIELSNSEGFNAIHRSRRDTYARPNRQYYKVRIGENHLLHSSTKRLHAPLPDDILVDRGSTRWGVIEVLSHHHKEKVYTLLVYKMEMKKVWEKTFDRPRE